MTGPAAVPGLRKLGSWPGGTAPGPHFFSPPPPLTPLPPLAGWLCEPPPDGAPLPPGGGVKLGTLPVGCRVSGV